MKRGIASGNLKSFRRELFNRELRELRVDGVKLFFEMEKALQDWQVQRERTSNLR